MKTFPEKPLGYIKEGLEELGHGLSYVYEDLVFPDHTAYLIQFGEENHEILLYMNNEGEVDNRKLLYEEFSDVFAGKIGFSVQLAGTFSLSQGDEENLQIAFHKGA